MDTLHEFEQELQSRAREKGWHDASATVHEPSPGKVEITLVIRPSIVGVHGIGPVVMYKSIFADNQESLISKFLEEAELRFSDDLEPT